MSDPEEFYLSHSLNDRSKLIKRVYGTKRCRISSALLRDDFTNSQNTCRDENFPSFKGFFLFFSDRNTNYLKIKKSTRFNLVCSKNWYLVWVCVCGGGGGGRGAAGVEEISPFQVLHSLFLIESLISPPRNGPRGSGLFNF